MAKIKFNIRSRLFYEPLKENKERSGEYPSETIQDQSMSVIEMLEKAKRGLLHDVIKDPIYEDGDIDSMDLEKVQYMDLHEKEILSNSARDTLNKAKSREEQKEVETKNIRSEASNKLDSEEKAEGKNEESSEKGDQVVSS